ncbi:hypothetical protein J6590_040003 [Homalodisca vitripennis]|nr:hypothetical protein J6590_099410 [Homalodisca vitripennis]KAG8273965.1 hypothetical protein J6590_011515 [Homalodisca vitripennis]KAG8321747.1 hypothetical protein J6590_040003 [Homalodisca vitripennis]
MNELDVNLEIQKRKRKKGVLNKSEYKAEIIKKARVSGSSYISWTGKEVPEITPGEDCKCRRKCFTKVADEERKRIFETFRSLGSKNEQDNYLQSLIAATEVKQKRRRKSSEISRKPDRGNTFIYEVSTPSGKQQFSHSHENPGIVKAKDFIDGVTEHTFDIKNTNRNRLNLPTQKAYQEDCVPINKKKMDDLEKLKPYLPDDEQIKMFYDKIFSWKTVNKGDVEID